MVEKKEEEKNYRLAEIPTQYGLAIITPEDKQITIDEAIVEILNEVKSIRDILGK